jgi:hypothetical protein
VRLKGKPLGSKIRTEAVNIVARRAWGQSLSKNEFARRRQTLETYGLLRREMEPYSASQRCSTDQMDVEKVSRGAVGFRYTAIAYYSSVVSNWKWSAIEIEAINKHIATKPTDQADRAMEAINNEWRRSSHTEHVAPGRCVSAVVHLMPMYLQSPPPSPMCTPYLALQVQYVRISATFVVMAHLCTGDG